MSNPIESIVTSLHWSKELQRTGWIKHDAFFYWIETAKEGWTLIDRADIGSWKEKRELLDIIPARTAEEILRRLPKFIGPNPLCVKTLDHLGWAVQYGNSRPFAHFKMADILVHAASAMYCFLSAQGLLPKP